MDIEKLEYLTNARKRTWQTLQQAIGAEAAARKFTEQCQRAVSEACAADEKTSSELYEFVRAEASKPEGGE